MHAVDSGGCSLVVSLLFEPTARVAAQVEAPDLVVDEDRQHERDGGQPPHEPERNITSYIEQMFCAINMLSCRVSASTFRQIDRKKKHGNRG